jgi:CheY-like chemotaxis protein
MIVLYAEDDIDDFDFFCEVLKTVSPDHRCINTRNGVETMDFLENSVVLPEIIFLDINMPTMDGKACLRNIKLDERFKSIPVVIYTTSSNDRDKQHCLQLGAVEYVQKPTSIAGAFEGFQRLFATLGK